MKVLLFGHSYVNHLRELENWDRELTLTDNSRVRLEFLFRGYAGKDFAYFLEHDETFSIVKREQPDAIVVILGGNSINDRTTNHEIKGLANRFFRKLKEILRKECIKCVVQVEPRYCRPQNRFGTPSYPEFERRRNIINNHYNKGLKKFGLVDRVVLLGSIRYLNRPEHFSDGVHLKLEGLLLYRQAILGAVQQHLNKQLEVRE